MLFRDRGVPKLGDRLVECDECGRTVPVSKTRIQRRFRKCLDCLDEPTRGIPKPRRISGI